MTNPTLIILRELTIEDYEAVMALWQATEGVGLSAADEPEKIARYLARNPGMSFTAWEGGRLAGAILCGHDGRRGYLHHLAVRDGYRRRGIGKRLVARALAALAEEGIAKCHLFVFTHNEEAQAFWTAAGWRLREELVVMSKYVIGEDVSSWVLDVDNDREDTVKA